MRSFAAVLLIVLSAPAMSGCAAGGIAAAGVTAGFALAQGQAEAFINGRLKAARMVSLSVAEHAILAAMEELEVNVVVHRRSEYDTYIMAKAKGGPEFRVTAVFKSPVVTEFDIRIGMIGDQAVSRLVMARIDAKLGIEQPVIPVEVSPLVAPPKPAPPPPVQHNQPPSEDSTGTAPMQP